MVVCLHNLKVHPMMNESLRIREIRTSHRYRVEGSRDGRWVTLSTHPGDVDAVVLHAESSFGGALRIVEIATETVLWWRDGEADEAVAAE